MDNRWDFSFNNINEEVSKLDLLNKLMNWMMAKIDQLIGFFGFYTQNYSRLLVYGLLILLVSKMFKSKVNVNANVGGKK